MLQTDNADFLRLNSKRINTQYAMLTYDEKLRELEIVAEIAIEVMQIFPPHPIGSDSYELFMQYYKSERADLPVREKKFRNLRSLKITEAEMLTYFQESSGPTVEYFWKIIGEKQLTIKRENRMAKILKRRKIRSDAEHDMVIDLIVPYQQEGLLNEEEVLLLNRMINDFERK